MLANEQGFIPLASIQQETVAPLLVAPSTPTTYTLELTSHCNERCSGCGNNELFSRNDPFLPGTAWIELLERIRAYACYVRVTGGECTLHPDFQAIVAHLDSFDIPFAIFTNGVWRDADGTLDFLKGLNNLTALLISLHGPDAETHNSFTGTRFFDTTLQNIRRAVGGGITVDTNTVFMRANQTKIADIVALSHDLGARCAVFSRYYGAHLPLADLSENELSTAIQVVDDLGRQGYHTKLNPCIPECFIESSSGGCGAGVTLCTIDPMGNVRPCNHAPLWMGNALDSDMGDIWASERVEYWRSLIPSDCATCGALTRCRGGCRATALHQKLEADPLRQEALPPRAPAPLRLYAGLRPVANFTLRPEAEGGLLVHFNRVVPVSLRGIAITETMDGTTTLADIQEAFGELALSFVVDLYEQGMIDLVGLNNADQRH
jgi:radical SAM protein with 4Fe4S-binding SPASM domain